jgi:hypothetical protein
MFQINIDPSLVNTYLLPLLPYKYSKPMDLVNSAALALLSDKWWVTKP